jgi:fluoroacetyl-CoA thioesterase
MKNLFKIGDTLQYRKVIATTDVAAFHGEMVHPVYATFALARDAEWTSRQFVLQMRDADEEGIGTELSIRHKGPAFEGEEIVFTATVRLLLGNELVCTYEAKVGSRLIATGETGQKILKRDKIAALFRKEERPA